MQKSTKRLGEILVEKGLISDAQLHDALQEQKLTDGFLGGILVKKGWINSQSLGEALSAQFGVALVDLKKEYINMDLVRKFSSSLILDHNCLPLHQDDTTVTVAIVNPLNAVAISKIEEEAKPRHVKLVLATQDDMNEAIQSYRRYVSDNIQRLLKRDKKPGE